MKPTVPMSAMLPRRHMLKTTAHGFAGLAAAAMLYEESAAAAADHKDIRARTAIHIGLPGPGYQNIVTRAAKQVIALPDRNQNVIEAAACHTCRCPKPLLHRSQ